MSGTDNGAAQQAPPSTVVDTGQGILVGVQPAQPRMANDFTGQSQPQQQQPPPQQPYFTAEDIERARQQEKEKLYPRIEEMSTQLRSLQEERQAEAAERQRLAEEAEAARRAQEEQEMDLRTLMEKREQEWQAQLEERDRRYEQDRAIFEKERQFAEVQSYLRDRLEQEQEYILPELREFVQGSTPEEIDQSIDFIKARSEMIVQQFAAAAQMQAQQQPFRGAAMPSVPPVGPMEQLPSDQPLTPEFLSGMDMKTYERHRDQLLRLANPTQRRGR